MKQLIMILFLTIAVDVQSQWLYQTIDNGFDPAYPIAFTEYDSGAYLKLEAYEGTIIFYISGVNVCDPFVNVDLVFIVHDKEIKYTTLGIVSNDSESVFFTDNLVESSFHHPFKDCTQLKIRIQDTQCGYETYSFDMSRSGTALKYMITNM